MAEFGGSTACPWRPWHATASTVPRVQGQGSPPGQPVPGGQRHDRGSRQLRRRPHRRPRVRYAEAGIARAILRVAVSGRRDQEASFFTVVVWRDQAEHAAQSLSKGSRVVVVGRLQQRSWTAEDGSARWTVEVVAEELGPSLRWATATTTRTTRSQQP
jgi:single-strand DNA-binding protein